jgi:hypothetical protein
MFLLPTTKPIAPALKNIMIYLGLSGSSNGIFKPLLDPGGRFISETAARLTAVSEVKRPLRSRFRSETVTNL